MEPTGESNEPNAVQRLASSLGDTQVRVGIAALAGVAALAIFYMRFCDEVVLPPKPAPPRLSDNVSPTSVTAAVEASAEGYAAFLAEDSAAYGVRPSATIESMSKKLPYSLDENRHELQPGGNRASVESSGLRITASARGSGRDQMLTLRIDNLTDKPLAYHIETAPERGTRECVRKSTVRHNALALESKGYVVRSECGHKPGKGIEILKIETMTLPELSYYYVSALSPASVGLDPRPTAGHKPPNNVEPCTRAPSASLERAVETGETSWRDLIDFYARHSCKTYRFPLSYKAFMKSGERPLPVVGDD